MTASEFQLAVQRSFRFLDEDPTSRLLESTVAESFDNAYICFATDGYRLRVLRERGQVFADFAPPVGPPLWFNAEQIARLRGREADLAEYFQSELKSLEALGALCAKLAPEVTAMFALPVRAQNVARLKAAANAEDVPALPWPPPFPRWISARGLGGATLFVLKIACLGVLWFYVVDKSAEWLGIDEASGFYCGMGISYTIVTLIKPWWFWEHPTAKFARRYLGDLGTTLVYCAFGLALVGVGVWRVKLQADRRGACGLVQAESLPRRLCPEYLPLPDPFHLDRSYYR